MKVARCLVALAGVVLVATSLGAGVVRADGLPVLGVDVGSTGVVTPSGQARYVTIPAGTGTVLARVGRSGGRILASTLLPATFTIPAVAYDGSASGLSGDGRTLVLIEPRASFPRTETTLAVIDTRQLRVLRIPTLDGDFSFDAVSPRGSLLYLIQYTSAVDPTRYNVRAYDLGAGRLLPAPVVDLRERGEKMRGQPLTRAASTDGRWAYTLYDGAGKEPFIHALDTSTRSARCIDLAALTGTNLSRLRLKLNGSQQLLSVVRGGESLVNVDLRSFRTSVPGGSGFPWLLAVLVTLGALVIAAALAFMLRRRGATLAPAQIAR
jgi:hypothetical protein